MADPEKQSGIPESPTTRQEPDWDDDDQPKESGSSAQLPQNVASPPPKEPKKVSFQEGTAEGQEQEEAPPARPPRPMSPREQAENTLIEAFPSVDAKVVKAVLTASGGQVEPAFNALLGMSDPNFVAETPPQQPPRPTRRQQQPLSQMEADELYARQLAEQYDSAPAGYGSRGRGNPPMGQRPQTGLKPNELHEDDHSFWDDDLPEIKKNLAKGFQETQKTVNKWILDFKKKIDGEDEDDPYAQPGQSSSGQPQRQNFGPSQEAQLRGIRRMGEGQPRRSGDRYDADPQVLGDDFSNLQMEDNEAPPKRPPRPQANPDLFKPTPAVPSGPIDEVDNLYSQPTPPGQSRGISPPAKGGKKWQPLTSVAPAPVGDDNDPFSLGDSDEEETKKTDLKPEDSERLKKSASVSEGSKPEGELKEAERSGSINTEAEELLKAAEKK